MKTIFTVVANALFAAWVCFGWLLPLWWVG